MTVGKLIEYLEQFDKNKKIYGYQLEYDAEYEYGSTGGLMFEPLFFSQIPVPYEDVDGEAITKEYEDGIVLIVTNQFYDGTENYLTSGEPTDEYPSW